MTWIKDSLESRTTWPYGVLLDYLIIEGSVTAVKGGENLYEIPFNNYDPNLSRADFHSNDDWDCLRIKGICFLRNFSEEVKRIIYDSNVLGSVKLIVKQKCRRTRHQKSLLFDVESDECAFEFVVLRNEVYKQFEVTADLCLGVNMEERFGFANKCGSIVANSRSVILNCDELESIPGGGMRCEWKRFPPDIENALYYFDVGIVNGTQPVIYINSRYPELKPIVDHLGRNGMKASIRDSINSSIFSGVWLELYLFAVEYDQADQDIKEFVDKVKNTLLHKIRDLPEEWFGNGLNYSNINSTKKRIEHLGNLLSGQQKLIRTMNKRLVNEGDNT
jgi:hypothetical protein